jgi:hypothetical protein
MAANASTETWQGDNSAYWGDPLNWVSGVAPGSTDNAVVDTNSGDWPHFYQGRTVATLLMRNGTSGSPTQIYTEDTSEPANTYTLDVSNMFTVEDSDSLCYVEQLGDGTIDAHSVTINAGSTANWDATLELSNGTLEVDSVLQLNATLSVDADATMIIAEGSVFDPNYLDLNGGDSSTSAAVFETYESATIGGAEMDGYSYVYIETGEKITCDGNLKIGSDDLATNVVFGADGFAGEWEMGSGDDIAIEGGDGSGESTILTISYGTLDASSSSRVRIREGSYSDDHSDYAQLVVGEYGTFTPCDMALQGDARLDFDVSVTVSDDFEIVGANNVNPTIDLAADAVVTVGGTFEIEGGANGVTIDPTFGNSVSKIQTN